MFGYYDIFGDDLPKYEDGSQVSQQDSQNSFLQQVASAIESGDLSPHDAFQALVEKGMSQEDAAQTIETIVAQSNTTPQTQMRNGGGIHIKPSHEGRFTEWADRHGYSMSEAIQAGKHSDNPDVRKMATFADNARHWKKEDGGELDQYATAGEIFGSTFRRNKQVQQPLSRYDAGFEEQIKRNAAIPLDDVHVTGPSVIDPSFLNNLETTLNYADSPIATDEKLKQEAAFRGFDRDGFKSKVMDYVKNNQAGTDVLNALNFYNDFRQHKNEERVYKNRLFNAGNSNAQPTQDLNNPFGIHTVNDQNYKGLIPNKGSIQDFGTMAEGGQFDEMEEGGEYILTKEQIDHILRNGGDVEYI